MLKKDDYIVVLKQSPINHKYLTELLEKLKVE